MDIEAIKKALGLPPEATEEQVMTAIKAGAQAVEDIAAERTKAEAADADKTTRKFQYGVMNNKAAFEAITGGSDERALQGEFKTVQAYDSIADGHTVSKGLTTLIDNDELEEVPGKLEEKIAWLKQLLLRAVHVAAIMSGLKYNRSTHQYE